MPRHTLEEFGRIHGTDKVEHGYLPFYEIFLKDFEISHLLEIGVHKGASLRMWRDWLPTASCVGWDIKDVAVEGCLVERVDSRNRNQMAQALGLRKFDVIIDDGGHRMLDQQLAFSVLIQSTKFFIIEDLHTSWIEKYFDTGDVSTWELLTRLESDRAWLSDYSEESEKVFIEEHVELVGLYRAAHGEYPRSATAILRNAKNFETVTASGGL